MRRYETIYILRPSLNEEQINTIVDNSNSIVTDGNGKIIELDRWGMRKLAYPIRKELQGFYIFCDYSAEPEAVAEMERKFRIEDAVLRYMTVKTADAISDEEIAEATDKAANKKIVSEETEESADEESSVENDDADTSEEE